MGDVGYIGMGVVTKSYVVPGSQYEYGVWEGQIGCLGRNSFQETPAPTPNLNPNPNRNRVWGGQAFQETTQHLRGVKDSWNRKRVGLGLGLAFKIGVGVRVRVLARILARTTMHDSKIRL